MSDENRYRVYLNGEFLGIYNIDNFSIWLEYWLSIFRESVEPFTFIEEKGVQRMRKTCTCDFWNDEHQECLHRYCTIDDILEKQKPEIDDMKKYVEEKAERFMLQCPGINSISYEDVKKDVERLITQIISDVKGRIK
jgi:hypothetical protein